MDKMGHLSLLAILAHPDDESFGNGGTLAMYAGKGIRTSLVCATRGEAGEISDPALATPDTLGQVREEELRNACSILGVAELRFLDYVDGTLQGVDEREAEEKMVRAIRELKPQVVFTFGPEGVYGHPDHIAVHRMATAAFRSAGDPSAFPDQLSQGLEAWTADKLYYVAPPRERFQKMGERVAELAQESNWGRDWSAFGVPEATITTRIDVTDYFDVKLSAIFAHQTQIAASSPFAVLPVEVLKAFSGEECYILAEGRVGKPSGVETDLFQGIGVTTGRGRQ